MKGREVIIPADNVIQMQAEKMDTEVSRTVTVEEANTYMDLVKKVSIKIAISIFTMILAIIPFLVLSGAAEDKVIGMTEDMAGGNGTAILLTIVAIAIIPLILNGMKLSKYEYLEEEIISLQFGVEGIVNKRKEAYADTYRRNLTGICSGRNSLFCIFRYDLE